MKGIAMDTKQASVQLKHQEQAITSLVAGLSIEEARMKPSPESWSILEVLNHLVDEESLDFRRHLDQILNTPNQPWPKIDPEGWVSEKQYNERQLDDTVLNFKAERDKSIAWLMTLTHPNWDASVSLDWGTLTAGDMLASWLAHDLLHLRQLIELRYFLTANTCQPHRVAYAEKW